MSSDVETGRITTDIPARMDRLVEHEVAQILRAFAPRVHSRRTTSRSWSAPASGSPAASNAVLETVTTGRIIQLNDGLYSTV